MNVLCGAGGDECGLSLIGQLSTIVNFIKTKTTLSCCNISLPQITVAGSSMT